MSLRQRMRLVATVLAIAAAGLPAAAQDSKILSRDAVLRDPDIPAFGNPKGDITIVEFFDYQCPYCKKVSPEIEQIAREDGKIRIVIKDWPILGPESKSAARLVLATRYQDRFEAAHRAVIGLRGQLTEVTLKAALEKAGIDVPRAVADLDAHSPEINALLDRNNEQAEAFGFNATPSFIVGTFRIPGALEPAMLKQAIADARAMAKQQQPKTQKK